MTKVVIDTNVLVSGILKPLGSEASVLNLVAEKYLTWCVSAAIIEEYLEVLKRRKFGFHPALIELWMEMAGTGFWYRLPALSPSPPMNRTTAF